MPNFSNIEYTDIVLAYGEAQGNANRARRIYQDRFPNRALPNLRTFSNVVQHLRDYGSFKPATADRGVQRPNRIAAIEEEILHSVEERPGTSTRRLAAQFNVAHSTVWKILKEQQLHPYHVRKVQYLQPEDLPRRLEFCEWALARINQQPNFLHFVLATDEAGFTREGVFNMHNTHVWADENPYAVRECNFQERFSINVWAGIINGRLIGPHLMPPRLDGQEYLNFLNMVLFNLLEDVPLNVRNDMWYLHDGAPCHYARIVRNWLDDHFPHRWIGRNGPVAWPPRSPDLNPCDFFLWGYMKDLVYSAPIDSIEVLQERVENAAVIVRNNGPMLQRVENSFRTRLELCVQNNGGHFENFM